MRIRSVRIKNYKGFRDSGKIRFGNGFNVIVGQNNVGKTALTEALSLEFVPNPHRSRRTMPTHTESPAPSSGVAASFTVDADELRTIAAREMPPVVHVPVGPPEADQPALAGRFLDLVSEGPTIEAVFESVRETESTYRPVHVVNATLKGYEFPDGPGHTQFKVDPASGELQHEYAYGVGDYSGSGFSHVLAGIFRRRLYAFRAVRFGIDEHPIGVDPDLASDASNLVQVLHLMQSGNPHRWERYVRLVRTVLPQIKAITFSPTGADNVRLVLWNIEPETEREDLAVPLSGSGTGVGQVLAMLYVAFASRFPRTIVIDEPQSFLHPGAVRKLFEILKEYPQHQYIITTHSPNAVAAAEPDSIFLVRKEGEESLVERLDVSETRDQVRFLREVGASLSDVFGADNVLWVEGPTEEECFPVILSEVVGRRLLGTKIVGVLNTGDLEGRRSRDVYRIYERLSAGGGLVPPAVGFVFDREGRAERERADLDRESGGLVAFLPRRMYENYLLNPRAIAAVASGIEGFRGGGVAADEVVGWVEEYGGDPKYSKKDAEGPLLENPAWLAEADAANLLKDLFDKLSESRVAYDKIAHGTALTRWLCENAPEDLREVADLIEERLDCSAASSADGGAT